MQDHFHRAKKSKANINGLIFTPKDPVPSRTDLRARATALGMPRFPGKLKGAQAQLFAKACLHYLHAAQEVATTRPVK
eukprot:g34797.t1